MNSSGNMDSSQSDVSMRDEDYRLSDVESQNSEKSPRNDSPPHSHGHLSASADRYEISASTDDPLGASRKGFNKNRKLIIKNVPPVRYEEVKEFLGSYAVSNISISKRARHAVATLMHGEQAEEAVAALSEQHLMGTPVSVSIYPNECLLCVAHLPLNLDEADFRAMVGEYGAIERAFLMMNKEGRSKGYGFVEFAHNKELSTQARNVLDGKRVGSCLLHCDFLDTSIVSFEHLQSRCLYIDHLPPAFDNEMELRNIFSFIKTPTFFRLHSPGIQSPGKCGAGSFAVVEYENATVAEDTQKRSNGLVLCQQRIRVTFCLPGRPGIDIFGTLLAAHSSSSKQALLPNPAGAVLPNPVRDALTNPLIFNLLAQNPPLLQNFQKVLQRLHKQTQPQIQKPGLLGVAPHLPSSPLMNPNLQVALLAVLLAMQLQQFEPSLMMSHQLQAMLASNLQNEQNNSSGSTRPSLLGNPMIAQANSLLQNLALQPGSSLSALLGSPLVVVEEEALLDGSTGFNLNQLTNWPQLLGLIQRHLSDPHARDKPGSSLSPLLNSGQGLLGDAPTAAVMRKSPLLGIGMGGGMVPGSNLKPGLLGDAPNQLSMGRPILGAGPGPEGEKRNVLGPGPATTTTTMLFADPGSKENMNMAPANPLLAIYLEGLARRQLSTLHAGNAGPAGSGAPTRFNGPPPPPQGMPPPPQGMQGPPQGMPPPPQGMPGLPHGMPPPPQGMPPPPHGMLPPPHGLPPAQGLPPPHGPPPLHMPPPRVMAQRRPPRQPLGPSAGASLLGTPHFQGQPRMPPPPLNTSLPPPQVTGHKTLLPNPVNNPGNMVNAMNNHLGNPMNSSNMGDLMSSGMGNPMNSMGNPMNSSMGNPINTNLSDHISNPMHLNNHSSNPLAGTMNTMMGPMSSRKPGLLGEHPGAARPPQQWQEEEEESGIRNQPCYQRLSINMPEKRGLLGDAPINLQGGRTDLYNIHETNVSENGNHRHSHAEALSNSNWGHDLWDSDCDQGRVSPDKNGSAVTLEPYHHKPTDGHIDPSNYLQRYQQSYHQFVNQYSQTVANTYHQGVSTFNSHQEALLPDGSTGNMHMPPPKTPLVGVKRARPHLLPSPESSPEGSYVGQHSQGLGGHYATSYTKKRRLI